MRLTNTLPRRGFGWLALAASFLRAVASPAAVADPLTAGRDVVVLTGLPGDVETETVYRAQLDRLLEVLALPAAAPHRVFVLNDSGEAGTTPSGLDVSAAIGNREGFLAVARQLAGSARPLTVFAWGHGGLMGREPVLHVRGPRLQGADFRALAEGVGAPSRWVLLFRHSGAFARALRAPGREILASEHDSAFKSDPVAMNLVLEILRGEPSLTLDGLARRLGGATVDWYEQQHLARQEEPTLWSGEEPPRRLADEAAVAAEADEPAREDAVAVASNAWDEVEPVSAERYPEASAVVLRKRASYVLAENPALSSESDEFIQVLTPEGTAHADFDIAYHPPSEKIVFLDLEVRLPDGTFVRLSPEEIRDATPEALPEYRPATRKIFSLPRAVPGAVLRVHFKREWRRFPLPHIPLEIPLAGPLPIVDSRIEIRVPREDPLHYAFRRHPQVEAQVRETPYGRALAWRFQDLEPTVDEVLSAPLGTPTLLVSTFPSWDSFAGWYRRLIRLADEATPEIVAKAAELTADARTERAKVAALYDFVTGLRYVAIPFGVNSHRPHAAANVFANRYGDCKDKANLFNTMLRSVGIEADLVLVPRFSQAYDATPGLGFNHAISRVRLGNEVIWADTTDDIARFGLLPPGDGGRNVLVIHEDVTGLTALPTPEPAAHRLSITGEIRLRGDGEPSPSELEITTAGLPDYLMRSLARNVGPRSGTQPIPFAHLLQPANGYFAMSGQRSTPVAALDRDFVWHAEGGWTGLAVTLGQKTLVRAPFPLPDDWRLALHDRETPLYLNRGYPLTLDQAFVLDLPEEVVIDRLPERIDRREGPLRWRLEWKREASRLEARLEIVLEKGELDADETAAFMRELRRLYEAVEQGALVEL